MTEALWAARPLPQLRLAESSWRGSPTTLAELRSMRMQLRARVGGARLPSGAGEDDVERLLLSFEELVSNALRHAAGPVRAAVTDVAGGWLLQVSDASGDTPPVPAVDRDAALGGLGLYLVAQICAAHGWTADDEGRKVVWARVDFTGGPGGADAGIARGTATAAGRPPVKSTRAHTTLRPSSSAVQPCAAQICATR